MTAGRRYEIEMPLGKGGFGTVYRARFVGEGGFSKVVALKVLNRDMAGLEEVLARLRDEARLLGLLRHRAIVRADRLVRLADRWTVVMEYVEGVDLKRILAHCQVPPGAAIEIIGEVAAALHAAWHTPGPDGSPLHLIHRDIKPSNIVLTAYGEIKVLDFGIARADFGEREAETKAFGMGSLPYMAPERLDFRDTAAADVYALGVVFFELVTGRAFGRASAVPDRHAKHVDAALRFLIDQGLASRDVQLFLGSLLAYEPEERPPARQLERMCVNLRRRFEDEPLRYWAERVVPEILAQTERLPPDEFTGSSLVEQTEGSLAPGDERLAEPGAGPEPGRALPETTGSGSFAKPAARGVTTSSGGSGKFARPAASPTGGSGPFFTPVTAVPSGSIASGFPAAGPAVAPPPRETSQPRTQVPPPPAPRPPADQAMLRVGPPPAASATGRRRLLLAILVGLVLGVLALGGLAVGVWLAHRSAPSASPAVTPVVAPSPAPSVPPATPTPPAPEPAPAAMPPAVEPPPAPAPSASSRPRRTEPPTVAPPTSEPSPPESAPTGNVAVEGDAERVVLDGRAGRFTLPAAVPEGSYSVLATFPGQKAMVAGKVTVHADQSLTVRCSAGFTRCKAQ